MAFQTILLMHNKIYIYLYIYIYKRDCKSVYTHMHHCTYIYKVSLHCLTCFRLQTECLLHLWNDQMCSFVSADASSDQPDGISRTFWSSKMYVEISALIESDTSCAVGRRQRMKFWNSGPASASTSCQSSTCPKVQVPWAVYWCAMVVCASFDGEYGGIVTMA